MTIQKDISISPHVVPELPEKGSNLVQSIDNLFTWAQDQQSALNELNRQIVDKYNLHLLGTHVHPASWKVMKVKRPRYEQPTASTTKIRVPATANKPVYLVIGESRKSTPSKSFTLLEATTTLECDLSTSGVNGLDTGSIAASTVYYLYGVNNGGVAALISSITDPDTGPTGYNYGEWSYIGAFITDSSSKVYVFNSIDGFYSTNDTFFFGVTHNNLTATLDTISPFPVTSKKYYVILQVLSDGSGNWASCTGSNVTNTELFVFSDGKSGVSTVISGFVSSPSPPSIWSRVINTGVSVQVRLHGWIEDPTEFP